MQRTLAIIKPDAVRRNLIGSIIHRFEASGFKIVGMQLLQLTEKQAQRFYHIHEGKPFYDDLVAFMTSGPCVPLALEKEHAIDDLRTLIGATDSRKAACGTIRQNYGSDIQENAVHASDSWENALFELGFIFPDLAK